MGTIVVCTGVLAFSSPATRIRTPTELALPLGLSVTPLHRMLQLVYAAKAETVSQTLPALKGSLRQAGYRPLTPRDVDLSRALNSGYLLRLSTEPRLAKLRPFGETSVYEGKMLIYVRGHQEELIAGRLLGPKLGFLQARCITVVLRPLANTLPNVERWVAGSAEAVMKKVRLTSRRAWRGLLRNPMDSATPMDGRSAMAEARSRARRQRASRLARLSRYEGGFVSFTDANPLAPFILEAEDDDRLAEALAFARNASAAPKASAASDAGDAASVRSDSVGTKERATYVERVAVADLFASSQNRQKRPFRLGLRSVARLAAVTATFFSPCKLIEPTFGEMVLAWQPVGASASLQLRAYRNVPIANFEALLPSARLVFRPADALRLDIISFLSVISALATARFTSLPARLVATAAIIFAAFRSVFAYLNALARYDLRLSRFRASKLTVSGDPVYGALAREAAQQSARVAAMVYQWMQRRSAPISVRALEAQRSDMVRDWTGDDTPIHVDVPHAVEELVTLGLLLVDDDGDLSVAPSGAGAPDERSILGAYLEQLLLRMELQGGAGSAGVGASLPDGDA